ncbi:MAG TPA: D-2-hydroxyacid dehydrogenase [Dongiaceae bacterium]|nr:D-2-hydroxyacid dehydrogenase [Dongiaceae bacterium]
MTAEHVSAAAARAAGPVPELVVDVRREDDPALESAIARADVLVASAIPRGLIAGACRLSLIQLSTSGIDHLMPLDWLPPDTALTTARGIHGSKLSEWAMMVFLMLHNGMPHFATAQRRHRWERLLRSSIAGKRALIFGTGGIGRAIAAGAHRLDVEAIGVRRSPGDAPGFKATLHGDRAMQALGMADFVVLALPLTSATRRMADAAFFAHMHAGAGFANFGRGDLVDQAALSDALDSGHLGGAIIDVASPEPLPAESALWDVSRLVITPHVSADDPEGHVGRVLDVLVENLRRRRDGLPLLNEVDRVRAY